MHGVKRFHLTEEAKKAKQAKEAAKIKNYKVLTSSILAQKEKKVYSDETFKQTTDLLNVNPEFYTVWNYRRDIISNHFMTTLDSDALAKLFDNELIYNMLKFKQFPKVYWIWNHRVWCLNNHPHANWEAELGLVEKILTADARNFHGWSYRRFIVSKIEEVKGESLCLKEFEYTTTKINNNFSNFSAWHNRTKLIPQLLEKGLVQGDQFLVRELVYLKNAMYTDPEDQSVFIYLRWLLTSDLFIERLEKEEYLKILRQELQNIEELNELEKDDNGKDNNWCLKTIVTIKQLIGKVTGESAEVKDSLSKLIEADPLRKNRYIDLMSS